MDFGLILLLATFAVIGYYFGYAMGYEDAEDESTRYK
jgi:hypothetical protein